MNPNRENHGNCTQIMVDTTWSPRGHYEINTGNKQPVFSPVVQPQSVRNAGNGEHEICPFDRIDSNYVLRKVHDRWKSGDVYWNLGDNLLMINPNRNLNQEARQSVTVQAFASSITDNLSFLQENQSVIALGSTGSGKTVFVCFFHVFFRSKCVEML